MFFFTIIRLLQEDTTLRASIQHSSTVTLSSANVINNAIKSTFLNERYPSASNYSERSQVRSETFISEMTSSDFMSYRISLAC